MTSGKREGRRILTLYIILVIWIMGLISFHSIKNNSLDPAIMITVLSTTATVVAAVFASVATKNFRKNGEIEKDES